MASSLVPSFWPDGAEAELHRICNYSRKPADPQADSPDGGGLFLRHGSFDDFQDVLSYRMFVHRPLLVRGTELDPAK